MGVTSSSGRIINGLFQPIHFRGGIAASGMSAYVAYVINTHGASEIWKLTDIVSGTTAPAQVAAARDGVQTGLTLQDTAGPVTSDAGLAPRFEFGTTDEVDLFTASMQSIFNTTQFTFTLFIKMLNAAVWDDLLNHYMLDITGGGAGNSALRMLKVNNVNATLRVTLALNGVSHTSNVIAATHGKPTDWLMWSAVYAQGVNVHQNLNGTDLSPVTTLSSNTWTSSPAMGNFDIGRSSNVGAALNHAGWGGYVMYFPVAKSAADLADIYSKRLVL
jgi:hypothetical protein